MNIQPCNIEARKGKGFGIKNRIMEMLEEICFGPFTFEVAFTLRDSLLISSTLTNSEAWLGLTKHDVEQLEQVDESLMRRFLEVGQGVPKEMLYLELGFRPIRFTIMIRKIMFLQYILNEESISLINQVFRAQSEFPSKSDFILEVKEIMNELDISLSFDDIKSLSVDMLQNFAKKQADETALKFLNKIKLKHTKVMHIVHNELEMQDYLLPQNISSIKLAKFIFSARTRMLDIGGNFSKKYGENVKCKLGCDALDNQEHLMECSKLIKNLIQKNSENIKYEDLFSNRLENKIKVGAILEKNFKERRKLEKENC